MQKDVVIALMISLISIVLYLEMYNVCFTEYNNPHSSIINTRVKVRYRSPIRQGGIVYC